MRPLKSIAIAGAGVLGLVTLSACSAGTDQAQPESPSATAPTRDAGLFGRDIELVINNQTSESIWVETKGRDWFDLYTEKKLKPKEKTTESGWNPNAIIGNSPDDEFETGNPRNEDPYIKRPGSANSLKPFINFRPGESVNWYSKKTGYTYTLGRSNDVGNSHVVLYITIYK